jgi:hypothetical protein
MGIDWSGHAANGARDARESQNARDMRSDRGEKERFDQSPAAKSGGFRRIRVDYRGGSARRWWVVPRQRAKLSQQPLIS